MSKLDVRNLSISFRTNNGAVRAVRDISFSLSEGETLAVAGESGSGKSVTARAVMGILAGNSMVENGEIIYDGRDLLKIPEEDFHTLRGHKLSMVFQDPLSALNPVMRIGRQLTEAMILNNRERRRDGRARFNHMLTQLEQYIVEAYANEGAPSDVAKKIHEKVRAFDHFVTIGVKREQVYEAARSALVEAVDLIDEIKLELIKGAEKQIHEISGRLWRSCANVYDAFLVPEGDAIYIGLLDRARDAEKQMTIKVSDVYRDALDALKHFAEDALKNDIPNFFCLGYCLAYNVALSSDKAAIAQINAETRRILDERFMIEFINDIAKAIAWSRAKSDAAKLKASTVLNAEISAFKQTMLHRRDCHRSAARACLAVQSTIDPLALEKDNASYVFRTSIQANIKRYFRGLKVNPKEEKRFRRDTVIYSRRMAQGKFAATVVPLNLIHSDTARQNIVKIMEELQTAYSAPQASQTDTGLQTKAVAMIDYLKDRSSEVAFRLSKAMARHRALALMDEVGIPEPHKRFSQYPFEFSGGMRQRIVIAIALSANPDILICDEPTTALDVTIQAQILELINKLKVERKLSVIFITHDLGVVANMADRIAIMYAGRIVEYGTAEDVFYDPRHPYTWALLSSMPDLETKEKLEAIPGSPPDMIYPPDGDAFAPRNHYALQIDLKQAPPFFHISDTHIAATWLLHPDAPSVPPPPIVRERIDRMRSAAAVNASERALKGVDVS